MDYLSKHPVEEVMTEKINEEENVIRNLSELFKLNHTYGQLLNADAKVVSTDQSVNITLKTNRELTNEIASSKKFFPGVALKYCTREKAEAINSISKLQTH